VTSQLPDTKYNPARTPHICLFTDSIEPSGMGEHMLLLAGHLRGKYKVSLVCPPAEGAVSLLAGARKLGLNVFPLDARRDPEALQELSAWLRTERVDVFHCHAGIAWEGLYATQAARRAGVPSIVRTEHLPYLITDRHQVEHHAAAVADLDLLICVSEAARRSYLRAGVPERKLCVVRNGVAPRPAGARHPNIRESLRLPSGARVVLTIGRFTEQKNHKCLLDAVPSVLARVPSTYFMWAGTGPLEDELRRLVLERGLENNVRFLGRRTDVPDLMQAADLFVLPSKFEGLPLVVLEAMAAGLPVVGTDVCGTGEAVRDGVTGRLVAPEDAAALSAAISAVLLDSRQASRMGAAARYIFHREFTVARMVTETEAIYAECHGHGAHRTEHKQSTKSIVDWSLGLSGLAGTKS
jgi:glycosyltransferase involved in cell wall biosynthesis